ncbi:MAG: hypothetical protein HY322_12500 [Betaproteobacteria bacterium]|nr:hypothetical protein [Betaproteobacteria bacterium]
MAIGECVAVGRQWTARTCAALLLLAAGCAADPERVRDAISAINVEFRRDYEAILEKNGTRVYKVTRAEAYDAIRVSLARLGMTVESQDPALGYVNVFAPAPRPLELNEWEQAAAADLPRTREIIGPHIGMLSNFFNFEPRGLETVISGTVVEVPAGAEVSFTVRMREIAPPQSGFPRREYLPPSAVRMGLDKIWAELEREFKATYRKP